MSRGSGLCRRCGGVHRGRSARVCAPIADCLDCGDPVCARHCEEVPEREGHVCKRCLRRAQRRQAPAARDGDQ